MVDTPDYQGAISGIESGGNYGILGPTTPSGDRAYGKYQIMGANIPQWSQQYYGQTLTPQQFLQNPQAQDAIFNGRFGYYVNKYGPEGAARAWFAGEGGMNNPGARDQLGTSVQQYGQRFTANIGQSEQAGNSQAIPAPREGTIANTGQPYAQSGSELVGRGAGSYAQIGGGESKFIASQGQPTWTGSPNLESPPARQEGDFGRPLAGPTRPQINPLHMQNIAALLARYRALRLA